MQKKKYIVTHASPDQDAVSAVWLIKRFFVGWDEAEVLFVPAGETIYSYRKISPDAYAYITDLERAEVLHVDTGMGVLDHHQDDRNTCAAQLVYESLVAIHEAESIREPFEINSIHVVAKRHQKNALARMVRVINDFDHYREVYYSDANDDRYVFMLREIIQGLNLVYNTDGSGDMRVLDHGMTALDGIYRLMQNKIGAENEIETNPGIEVKTKFGTAVGYETSNDHVLDVLQKTNHPIVARKDPKKSYVRIKALPDKGIDLTNAYEGLRKKDPTATWFLHSSKAMILNGSTKNAKMRATKLSLTAIMAVIEKELA